MKQQEVTILGQSYILGCPDGGEALLSAAVASVDREMSAIRDAGKVKARETVKEGLDSTLDAFLGLFSGENTGKMLVKV